MHKMFALLMAFLTTPAMSQDIPGTEFTFGLWRGAAQVDAAGEFTHCYATLVFGGGDQLWLNVSKADRVEIIFSFLKATYEKDRVYESSIMMETGPPTFGTAFGMGGHLINFNLTPVHDAHVFLSQGSFLRMMGVGNDEAYEVRGIGGALGMVRACREAQRR